MKLAYITEFGKDQSIRMNSGLKVSPTTFAELIDTVLGSFKKYEVSYFIDDVSLAADSKDRMLTLLTEVLKNLIDHNITVELSKRQVCNKEIDFLDFKVHEMDILPRTRTFKKID